MAKGLVPDGHEGVDQRYAKIICNTVSFHGENEGLIRKL